MSDIDRPFVYFSNFTRTTYADIDQHQTILRDMAFYYLLLEDQINRIE